ncbi:MAG TPA: glycosyltransferase family 39 protein [Thermoanaerobaculia bacterium]|nr:glycosyltransferase family 39 protein [Thermoanaerobaculia bacterium]
MRSRAALAAAFLAFLALCVWTRWPLVTEGLWRDEAAAVYVAHSGSLSEFVARHCSTEYTPPLFNGLLAAYTRVFGFDERPLKVLALVLGLLSLAALAALAAQLFGTWAALAAVVLAANNPILLGLAAELRPYSLSVALSAVSLIFAVRVLRRSDPPNRGDAVLLTVCLALLAYSHIAGALTVFGIGLAGAAALVFPRSRAFGRSVLMAATIAGSLFAVWMPIAWTQFRAGLPYEPALGMSDRTHLLLSRIHLVAPDLGGTAALLAAGGVIVIFWLREREVRARVALDAPELALLSGLSLVVVVLLGLFSRADRYLSIPAALLSVATAGLLGSVFAGSASASGFSRSWGWVVFAALLIGSFAARAPFYAELREASARRIPKSGVRTLCTELSPGQKDLLIAVPDYLATTLWFYCGPNPQLRGAALWQNALLLDWRTYGPAWTSPLLVPTALDLIEKHVASQRPSRLVLIRDTIAARGTALSFPARMRALRRAIESRFPPARESTFPGRVESVETTEFPLEAAGPR